MKLMRPSTARDYQQHVAKRVPDPQTVPLKKWMFHDGPFEYGGGIVLASGRATCWGCGQRIKKGERCIMAVHDFSPSQSGSYASTECYIHLNCEDS